MKLSSRAIVGSMVILVCAAGLAGVGCSAATGGGDGITDVVTDTSFLADIVSNVAGDRLTVSSLIPQGVDPHTFEPTPRDARRLAESRAVVINAYGLVPTIDDLVDGVVGPSVKVTQAAAGIPDLDKDPHCWLDPVLVMQYVENIAAALTALDPAGAEVYAQNAVAYTAVLRDLDGWIKAQVATIPPDHRLLVTDHESLGRFAARYGFTVVGSVSPTSSGDGSPSARGLAELINTIKESGAPAIFLEAGGNRDVAEQVSKASGAKVVTDLYTHSLGPGATTYVGMMHWNVTKIVEALM